MCGIISDLLNYLIFIRSIIFQAHNNYNKFLNLYMSTLRFGQGKLKDYQMTQQLGKGAYGRVIKGENIKNNYEKVAIKQIFCEMQSQGLPSTSVRQITLLKDLDHPNIVKLLDVILEPKAFCLVFQYLSQDLKKYLEKFLKMNKELPPKLIKKLMHQLLNGVAQIHSKRILHRDLKPANLLLDQNNNLKIADFGLARTYSIPNRPYSHEVVTLYYRAPQILLGSVQYSLAIDMWSVGCIFGELVHLNPIFKGESQLDQIKRIFRTLGTPKEQDWPGVSKLSGYRQQGLADFPKNQIQNSLVMNLEEQGLDLLHKLLAYDPKKRITAKNALKHPYFDDLEQIYKN